MSFGCEWQVPQVTLYSSHGAPPSRGTFLSREELRNIFGPIALYPDVLLAQMLTAATVPNDIVQADRWLKTNPDPSTLLPQPRALDR
ncbi:MAG: hypothetical protein DCC65_11735 [Planctomycetota bacterium]|nr:MAG: hypothetical protein DCC65_11735 [Planctomycetota bacterium]